MAKLDGVAANTGQRVMQAARDALQLTQRRREEVSDHAKKTSTSKPANE
jgi:hypothetical protein